MKLIIISITFLSLSLLARGSKHHGPNYKDHIGFYWEDFEKTRIMKGVVGGKDARNRHTYIGLTKHLEGNKELLVPGVIYPWDLEPYMVYEWNERPKKIIADFKMLYTNYPDHMTWIKTNTSDIRQLVREKELISAGYDTRHRKYYIGRIPMNDNLILGKIIISNNGDNDGFFAFSKSGYHHAMEFEVLVHELKLNSIM
ncbi:hypothetical protein PPYR_04074 [Photinus pyralis]|uniref:Uncharacterized protein n=1 Tax=Photinus pyralis TaxID=7054 RepID=A0A5N4AXA2_PHOPY|nr:uncharacterized protein LOC116162817 [Photinus pyralis]KAB0801888.1 hypothetical protein PPYR_04074 [Photinus pyralis]